MATNFISSKEDSDEALTMHTQSDNIEIMMGSETNEIIEEVLNLFCKYIKKDLKCQWMEVILFLIVLMHCIIILIR